MSSALMLGVNRGKVWSKMPNFGLHSSGSVAESNVGDVMEREAKRTGTLQSE